MATSTHKLGNTRAGDGTRIWFEGQRLKDNGFAHGAICERVWSTDRDGAKLVIRIAAKPDALTRANRTTVSGSDARPVIDIVGDIVNASFPSGRIEASWSKGRIVVKGV